MYRNYTFSANERRIACSIKNVSFRFEIYSTISPAWGKGTNTELALFLQMRLVAVLSTFMHDRFTELVLESVIRNEYLWAIQKY